MTSYLIDLVLLAALVVTALRSGRMVKELKTLRDGESALAAALAESDRALTRAAETVVALKHEGVRTVAALETRIDEADETIRRLEALLERADWHVARRAQASRAAGEAKADHDTAQHSRAA